MGKCNRLPLDRLTFYFLRFWDTLEQTWYLDNFWQLADFDYPLWSTQVFFLLCDIVGKHAKASSDPHNLFLPRTLFWKFIWEHTFMTPPNKWKCWPIPPKHFWQYMIRFWTSRFSTRSTNFTIFKSKKQQYFKTDYSICENKATFAAICLQQCKIQKFKFLHKPCFLLRLKMDK